MGRIASGAVVIAVLAWGSAAALAQETDITQTPNTANAGIKKSLKDQIGNGRGDVNTPLSSAYLIARDPFRSIARGRQIFQRKFRIAEGAGPRTGDGVGNIETDGSIGAGLADSCAACHGRPQGAAGFGGDVFTRPTSRDAPHLFGLGLQEMLADEITTDLRAIELLAVTQSRQKGRAITKRLFSKGIRYGTITAFANGSVDRTNVKGVNADLRVRPFFAEGSTISIREFVVGAFNAEMGLEAFDPDLAVAAAGGRIVTPSGMVLDGTLDSIEGSPASSLVDDPDRDGVVDEIPESVVDHTEFYLLNYFKPGVRAIPAGKHAQQGKGKPTGLRIFEKTGCATCHVPELTIERDRRVADVDTVLDPQRSNPFNNLFATANALFAQVDDGSGEPTLKTPLGGRFVVENFYADMKRHDLGPAFWERNFDGSIQKEFMTEPLWGVGSTAPYGHDGRSPTLDDVIRRHGGEARKVTTRYVRLKDWERQSLLGYLRTLVIFSPPSTASNLGPRDVAASNYPLNGHGSIDLSALFNDPADKE